ncbi:MAG TPA: tRNA pseudouridine(38-40) synthase TruA [Gammaproteobacteria bacterium]|nr:tRNA pseudouridine(38-40) synthase TruA [Pseudomonadota bacterium]HAY45986.1 tRNA pseudouridine(38-40) synthase TruA [Gammaproteobacteria bacterium]
MARYAAVVEYHGSEFKGWQAQDGERTVQRCVEQALSEVAGDSISIVTAGRTDSGVHATGQVIHFDSPVKRTDRAWVLGSNTALPTDIRLRAAQQVGFDFHARFKAIRRSYRYIVLNQPIASAVYRKLVTHEYRSIDVPAMQQAAMLLVGENDYSSFRAAGCQARSPVRTISKLEVGSAGSWIWIDVVANAFLQHMVRNLAGVLLAIGAGEKPVEWATTVLQAKDRTKGGVTARPEGLYLTKVEYPSGYAINMPIPEPVIFW